MSRIERLPNVGIVDANGRPTLAFTRWWQKVLEAQEATDAAQDAAIASIAAAQATATAAVRESARINSYTTPTNVLTAADVGSTATITVAAHTRVYPVQGTYDVADVSVGGGTITGLAFSTEYAVYYDDTTLASTTPTYQATTTIKNAQVGAAAGRHFVGTVTTPADGGGGTTGGGGYPPGGYPDLEP